MQKYQILFDAIVVFIVDIIMMDKINKDKRTYSISIDSSFCSGVSVNSSFFIKKNKSGFK